MGAGGNQGGAVPDEVDRLIEAGLERYGEGELDEALLLWERALAIDPDNGSYLDSIGWAYFKDGKIDLALENMKRAADQLPLNSVVQDHYGDVLSRSGRVDEAIAAWNKALAGDGDSIERSDIEKKIRAAQQKLPKR